MHITFVTPAFLNPERSDFPGIRRYSTELATALDRSGVAVRVVTPEERGQGEDKVGNIEVVRLRPDHHLVGRVGNVAQARILSFARRLGRTPAFLKDTDLVHSNIPLLGIDSVRRGCPVVATGHHVERVRGPQDLLSVPFGNSYGSYTYRRADAVVVPSEATASRLSLRFHVNRKRIWVIHHGIDTVRFHPEEPDGSGPRTLGARRVLFVGPMNRRKNVLLLLQAFTELARSRHDVQLVLVGSGPLDAQIERSIRKDSLREKVIRSSRVAESELRELYCSADLFASPSLDEGFGFSTVEAMACRIPVVVLDTQINREIVGDAGVLVPEAVPEAWGNALRGVLEDSRFAEELAERGYRRARERYSWASAADNHVHMYQDLIDRRKSNGLRRRVGC